MTSCSLRVFAVVTVVLGTLAAPSAAARIAGEPLPQTAAATNCVTLGAPRPALSFTYRYSDTRSSSEHTNRWEEFTATGSRLITTRTGANAGQSTYVSQHLVADDVFVLAGSTASGTDGGGAFNNTMTYSPGAIGDPAFKACVGKTWQIPQVNATSRSARGSFSLKTDPGAMTIVSVRESVTVPAGTFDTVHYTKTMGQVVDNFWKSTEHGVTVKRTSSQPGSVATEILIGIK